MSTAIIQRRGNFFNFDPKAITGCSVWLDATGLGQVTNITSLRDKSANAYLFVTTSSTTPPAPPLYSETDKRITFTPTQSIFFSFSPLAMNNTSKYVFFLLANFKSGSQHLFSKQFDFSGTMNLLGIGRTATGTTENNKISWWATNTSGVAVQTGTVSLNTKTMVVVWYDGTTLRFRINGDVNSSTVGNFAMANDTSATSGVGASMCTFGNLYSSYWSPPGTGGGPPGGPGTYNWDLHEFVYYNNDSGIGNIQIMEGYLAWKWGIQGKLPLSHPYSAGDRTIPPSLSLSYPLRIQKANFFSPRQISNCVLWMDAADRSSGSMQISATGTVTSWFSKANANTLGSLGRILVPGSIGTTGLPTISVAYNAAPVFTNVLGFGGNTAQTNIMVVSVPSNANNANLSMIRYLTAGGGGAFGLSLGTSILFNAVNASQNQGGVSVTLTTTTRAQAGIVIQDGSTQYIYESGTAGNSANYTLNQIDGRPRISYLASSTVSNCEVAEIIIYSKALSTAERQQVEGYIAWKWGLTANLPATHPYKNVVLGLPNPVISQPNPIKRIQWSPTLISGCQFWLDGADRNSLVLSGTNVTQWGDKSGNNRNFTQETPTQQPTYNLSEKSVLFDGTDDLLVGPDYVPLYTASPSTFNIFVVGNALTISTNNVNPWDNEAFIGDNNGYHSIFVKTGLVGSYYYNTANGTISTTQSITAGANIIVQLSLQDTILTNRLNGNLSSSTSGTLPIKTLLSPGNPIVSVFQLGGQYVTAGGVNRYLNCKIYEVILFNSALTTSQRQQVEGYLAWKWGLQTNLPSSHPYKLFPPPP